MIRDALTSDTAPTSTGAVCVVCGRWTGVPVEVGYVEQPGGPGVVLWGCPDEITTVAPGPMPGEGRRAARVADVVGVPQGSTLIRASRAPCHALSGGVA